MQETNKHSTNILLISENSNLADRINETVSERGFNMSYPIPYADAVQTLAEEDYALTILDTPCTDKSSYSLCRYIKDKYNIPVIFTSEDGNEYSVIAGLESGADDYIIKPCRPRELISRIKTVLRRTEKNTTVLKLGDLRVDTVKGMVTKNGKEVFLSALEYRILLIFLSNRGSVLSRTALLEEIWSIGGDYVNNNTLTVYIKRIREKIEENPAAPQLIKTVRGVGYIVGE